MPKTSIADLIVAWENVLTNVKANASEVPNLDVYTAPLEEILASAKDLNARLDNRIAVKQEESKERRVLMLQGKKQVSRVRAALKAHFGVDSERLIEFGARPIRPRSRKNPLTVPVPAAPPPVPSPVPPPHAEAAMGKPVVSEGSAGPEGVEKGAPRNPTAP